MDREQVIQEPLIGVLSYGVYVFVCIVFVYVVLNLGKSVIHQIQLYCIVKDLIEGHILNL